MTLIDELNARKAELVNQTQEIDREAARLRGEYEEKLAALRVQRIPLEERIRTIEKLVESEGGH